MKARRRGGGRGRPFTVKVPLDPRGPMKDALDYRALLRDLEADMLSWPMGTPIQVEGASVVVERTAPRTWVVQAPDGSRSPRVHSVERLANELQAAFAPIIHLEAVIQNMPVGTRRPVGPGLSVERMAERKWVVQRPDGSRSTVSNAVRAARELA